MGGVTDLPKRPREGRCLTQDLRGNVGAMLQALTPNQWSSWAVSSIFQVRYLVRASHCPPLGPPLLLRLLPHRLPFGYRYAPPRGLCLCCSFCLEHCSLSPRSAHPQLSFPITHGLGPATCLFVLLNLSYWGGGCPHLLWFTLWLPCWPGTAEHGDGICLPLLHPSARTL